jgi:diaminopimelate decarboxylase
MDLAREIVSSRFPGSGEKLQIGGIPIDRIVGEFGTPLFIYDTGILEQSWNVLRSTFPDEFGISYSVKANPNPHIMQIFLAKGCGLEIASAGELHLALKAACPPSRLLFAGPGKSEAELELALSSRVGEIHVESMLEAQRVNTISRRLDIKAPVALRVNPSSAAQGGAMQMGGKPAPFGVDEEQLDDTVAKLLKFPSLEFRGLHFYLGTQILDHDVLVRQYRHALEIVKRVVAKLGRPLETVDFGGGLGIPYFAGERALDMEALRGALRALMSETTADRAFDGTRFIIEPGRYLVGESGVYVARVSDIKISRGKKYVIVDGGMNHHLAASGNLGQVIKRNFPIAVVNKLTEKSTDRVEIVGPLCTPLDTLGRYVELPKIEIGDLLGVFQSGAYARTASPLGFLSYPSPAEVLVEGGRAALIRRRGTVDDLLTDIPRKCSLM